MWALVIDGNVEKIFRNPQGFKSKGLTYGPDIFDKWSLPQLNDIGIYAFEDIKPDVRFYESSDNGYSISDKVYKSYSSTEKDLEGLKQTWIVYVKEKAKERLSNTDWMVLRFVETATPIPTVVQNRRNNIRQRSTTLIKAINDCTTIEEFKALFESMNGNNPPIEDWPEG